MNEIEQYLDDLTGCLRLGGRDRARVLAEVRDHLEDAIAHREATGESHARAIAQALSDFGPAAPLATEFNATAGTRAMRRAPMIAFAAGIFVFGGFLLAGTTQPRPAAATNASFLLQVAFFVAVLAFQVAVVAGICTASRAVALWSVPVARGRDRAFVRRAAALSTLSVGAAAVAWAAVMALAFGNLPDPNGATLVAGGAVMLAGATVAILSVLRLRLNLSDEPDESDPDATFVDGRGVRAIGEQCIALVRRHPVASCGAAALLSAIPAMSHAETTLSGAIPWGLAQAATVIAAFVALGPSLGLRERSPA